MKKRKCKKADTYRYKQEKDIKDLILKIKNEKIKTKKKQLKKRENEKNGKMKEIKKNE